MIVISSRHLAGPVVVLAGSLVLAAEPAGQQQLPDLSGYRTIDKALTTRVSMAPAGTAGQTGYLGVSVQRDDKGRLVVVEVQANSPAAKAGVKKDDVVTRIGDQAVKTSEALREWLQTRRPGEAVKLGLLRDDKAEEVSATLTATSKPMKGGTDRLVLGVTMGDPKEGEGVLVERVTPRSGADNAGLKSGDYIAKVDGRALTSSSRLADMLFEKKAGDSVVLAVRRDGKDLELKATLAVERTPGGGDGRGGRGGLVPNSLWTKNVFRLAVVCIEFPDVKHNDKVKIKDWEEILFSCKRISDKETVNVPAGGSLNEYFQEQSYGGLRLEGTVFNWVEVAKKRADYVQGSGTSNRTALPVEALDKVVARDGKDAFKEFDGFLFLYAGDRVPRTNPGSLYYPHAGSISHQSRRLPYLLTAEGGSKPTPVSGFVKAFGQVLGLPDLAARTENAGSEGLGVWCAMSSPLTTAKPQHFGPWAKEKLGWIKPAVIDPTVKQKLILSPIEDSAKECVKVLVRPDGSEYLLLENRKKKGFDSDLPGEGLLIWRVVNDRPILEESHGVDGPSGPTVHLSSVPYPSQANNAFTPETTPSSRSAAGGGLPVHITEVRRLPDGRVTFHVGYEYR